MKQYDNISRLFQVLILVLPALAFGQQTTTASATTPTPTAIATPSLDADILQQRLLKLQDELNEIEVESEKVQHRVEDSDKSPIQLSGGSLEQDFESNSDSWSILQGQTLRLRLLANPIKDVTGHFDLMFLGDVAPDILHYSYLPTLANENIFFILREADVTLDASILSFSAFKGQGHSGFYYTNDDFYYLFPDAWDIDNYFRVSGRAVPTGMEIKGEKDLDGLDIWAGEELQWGVGQEIYAAYKHNIGPVTIGAIDRISLQQVNYYSQGVTYAPYPVSITSLTSYTQAPRNTVEAFLKVPIADALIWDNVGIYSPTNLNKTYFYATPVATGTGTLGSNYQIYQGTTGTLDAMGYQVKLTTHKIPFLDSLMINGEYSGLVAGDLERISAEITEIPGTNMLFVADATVQKPIVGPLPLITYAGTGAPFMSPRGQFDPFRVTADPISGINNREMSKFSLSFVYNPGAGWFFRYNPNIFDTYNINTDLDTPFSTGIIGTVFNYPTSTDLTSYVNGAGQLVWEGTGSFGQPATNGYLPYVHWITMWKTDELHWILDLQDGYSMATLGQTSTNGHSSTNFFQGNLTTRLHNTSMMVGYGQDVWGPESWDQQFAINIGRLYLAQISQKFGNSTVSLKWEGWRNLPGDPYQQASVNGVNLPVDELFASYMLNF